MTVFKNVSFANNPQTDAFGRLRVSQQDSLFDSALEEDLHPHLWQQVTSGSGSITHLPNESSASLAVTATDGDVALMQSKWYMPYRPGKSQLGMFTVVFGSTPAGNVTKDVGFGDNNDGLFFRQDSTGMHVVVRTSTSGSPVDTEIPQASWNIDPLDGTGPSGLTADWTKAHILMIDYQWLGVGRVRFMVETPTGDAQVVHEIRNAGANTAVYMKTGTLPVRYRISNSGGVNTGTLKQICTTVSTEGGSTLQSGRVFSVGNGTTTKSITTRQCVIAVRPKTTFNSVTNRHNILPAGAMLYVDGAVDVYAELVLLDSALGGSPSFTSVATNSVAEYDVAGTTVSGEVIASGYVVGGGVNQATTSSMNFRELGLIPTPLALDYAGTGQPTLALVATAIGGTATVAGSLTWLELR